MARISTYEQDSTVSKEDKVIGTDSVTGGTKNFSLESILDLLDDETTYEHTQASSSSTWTITHNLDKYPSVTVVDNDDDVVYGDTNYQDRNTVIITFGAAFAGKAFLN